jgi:hypothetical protein
MEQRYDAIWALLTQAFDQRRVNVQLTNLNGAVAGTKGFGYPPSRPKRDLPLR